MGSKKSVSIKDIARAANVSYSTVSRALRHSELVHPETRARVLRWAEKLNYTANSIARGLVTRQTRTVGLVVTSIADPFLGEVVDGIEKVALRHGYSVFLSNGRSDPEQEIAVLQSFKERRVDGVLVFATRMSSLHMERLRQLDVPIVLINNLNPLREDARIRSISIDNLGGSRMAVEYLIRLGHRRIGYITDEKGDQSNRDRLAGYRSALLEAGLPLQERLIVEGDETPEGGVRAVERLLGRKIPFTALFCYNDRSAIGVLKALREAGLQVPRDISVVGFDDIFLASWIDLTTVRQPKSEMGGLAMEMMLKLIAGEELVANVTVPGELILRGSAGPPPPPARRVSEKAGR